jgi:hypothetical protein
VCYVCVVRGNRLCCGVCGRGLLTRTRTRTHTHAAHEAPGVYPSAAAGHGRGSHEHPTAAGVAHARCTPAAQARARVADWQSHALVHAPHAHVTLQPAHSCQLTPSSLMSPHTQLTGSARPPLTAVHTRGRFSSSRGRRLCRKPVGVTHDMSLTV